MPRAPNFSAFRRVSSNFDRVCVWIEGEDASSATGDGERQPAVAAADLEDARVSEVRHPLECREVRSFGIEDARPIHSAVVGISGDALA